MSVERRNAVLVRGDEATREGALARRGRGPWLAFCLVLLGTAAVVALAQAADATHYRYGTLSSAATGNANEAHLYGEQAWRWGAYSNPPVGAVLGGGCLRFGDGSATSLHLLVTQTNPMEDWFRAAFVTSAGGPLLHTYAAPDNGGAPWVATWEASCTGGASCCRISDAAPNHHKNNPDQPMFLQTLVDLDGLVGIPNSSPFTSIDPVQPCPPNAVCTISTGFADPDGDLLRHRFATAAEVAPGGTFDQPGPPDAPNAAAVDPSTGVITWDTTGATLTANARNYYSVAVVASDGVTESTVDFLICIDLSTPPSPLCPPPRPPPCDSNPLPAPFLFPPAAATPTPGPPAQAASTWSTSLWWTAVNGCGPILYTLERDTDPSFPAPVVVYAGPATTTSDAGLAACTTFHYRIMALDPASTPPSASPWSNTQTLATGINPPGAPVAVTVAWQGPITARVTWNPPPPNGCPLDLYHVYRWDQTPLPGSPPCSVGPPGCLRGTVPGGTTMFDDSPVVPCQTYHYAVSADNTPSGGSEGPRSPWVAYTHPLVVDTPPETVTVDGCAPCDLSVSGTGAVPFTVAAPDCVRWAGGAVFNGVEVDATTGTPLCGQSLGGIPEYFISSHGLDPLNGLPTRQAACHNGAAWVPLPDAFVKRYMVAAAATPILPPTPIWPTNIYNTGQYFVVGGIGPSCAGPGGTCKTVEMLDLATGAWSFLPPLPIPVASPGLVARSDGTLFVFGGRQCAVPGGCPALGVLQVYSGGGWSVQGMTPRSDLALAVSGCDVFLLGGHGANPAAIERYDTCQMAWVASPIPSGLPAPAANAVASVGFGHLCVSGGFVAGQPYFALQVYDFATQAWSQRPDPLARPALAQSHGHSNLGLLHRAAGPLDPLATQVPCV